MPRPGADATVSIDVDEQAKPIPLGLQHPLAAFGPSASGGAEHGDRGRHPSERSPVFAASHAERSGPSWRARVAAELMRAALTYGHNVEPAQIAHQRLKRPPGAKQPLDPRAPGHDEPLRLQLGQPRRVEALAIRPATELRQQVHLQPHPPGHIPLRCQEPSEPTRVACHWPAHPHLRNQHAVTHDRLLSLTATRRPSSLKPWIAHSPKGSQRRHPCGSVQIEKTSVAQIRLS